VTTSHTLTTRPLGHSDIAVTTIGLGCNNFGGRMDLDGTRAVLDATLEQGINFLDTADIYGGGGTSEQFIGELLGSRRERVVLATKFGMQMPDPPAPGPRGSRDYVRRAVEGSLRRLRTDVIDLYWYHEPDGQTPFEETLGALDELVQAGTVRAIGASNFSAAQIEVADGLAREEGLTRFTAVQNEYSLLEREAQDEVIPACERLGLAFVPYFPLASGLLTGKYRRGEPAPEGSRLSGRDRIATEAQFDVIESLARYAEERDLSLIDVAIGALLARSPAVASVIAGATKPEQVAANAEAASWEPTPDDLLALEEALARSE
jgi:aryl-alcohol dehydrogenase-like predicted oxidoreductase